jgi:hypothetical protein
MNGVINMLLGVISGFNTAVACIEIALLGAFVFGFIHIMNKVFPPFKEWFDKFIEGDL